MTKKVKADEIKVIQEEKKLVKRKWKEETIYLSGMSFTDIEVELLSIKEKMEKDGYEKPFTKDIGPWEKDEIWGERLETDLEYASRKRREMKNEEKVVKAKAERLKKYLKLKEEFGRE